MGLDMWLYRITRLNQQELRDIETMDYTTMCDKFSVMEWGEKDDAYIGQIKSYVSFVKRPIEQIDFSLAKKACGIPEDAEYSGEIANCDVWFFDRESDESHYEIDYWQCTDEQRKAMTVTNIVTFCVCHKEEVYYWRKAYALQEKIHKACNVPIENCGYYPLNDAMKKHIVNQIRHWEPFDKKKLEPTEDSVVCYHEWY